MIQSLERAFAIIAILSESASPLYLSYISDSCNLAPSTVHRMLDTLCSLGIVKNEAGGMYSLTPKLFTMTSNALRKSSLVTIALPQLELLSAQVHESVHLSLLDGTDIVYVGKCVQEIGSIQMASHVGKRTPLYRTATGKCMLAAMPIEQAIDTFRRSDVQAVTENTITDENAFMAQLAKVRTNGFAMDNEENEPGITCIGMPLGRDPHNIRYAFSVSSITTRFTPEHTAEIISAMKNTKRIIESELIGTGY